MKRVDKLTIASLVMAGILASRPSSGMLWFQGLFVFLFLVLISELEDGYAHTDTGH
jgi:hypothetical protein